MTVESRVNDKQCGDIGHPVQYDSGQSQWYISVATGASDNDLYPTINTLGTGTLVMLHQEPLSQDYLIQEHLTIDCIRSVMLFLLVLVLHQLDHLDRTTFSNNQMT